MKVAAEKPEIRMNVQFRDDLTLAVLAAFGTAM
jgi:hypothetical protein